MIKTDLHIHSSISDNCFLSLDEIIQNALQNEIEVIAITNYDIITAGNEIIL